MNDRPLRGALIGCGFFARNHLLAWREISGVQIVAVCDTDKAKADEYAREFGIQAVFNDAAKMFNSVKLDFVDIVTQPASHRPLVELSASRGLNVICQKPMAPALDDARAMVAACRAAGVRFMVHENFRWQTPMRALKAAAAEAGELFFSRIQFRSGYDVYKNQPYLATDERFILLDLGVHILDLARFFMGDVERMYCQTRRVNPRIKGEDAATALLATANSGTCIVDLSYATVPEEELFPQTLVHLEGPRGTAILGPHYRLTTVTRDHREERAAPPAPYSWLTPPAEALQSSVVAIQQHWVECLRRGCEPETSGADNLKTLELVFGAYQSAETKTICYPGAGRV